MDLIRHITAAVERYWADEVQILGIWHDGPASAGIVYRRTVDPAVTLGQRFEFHSDAADGTVEGFARDIAIDLAEPIGTARHSSPDRHGITWVAISDLQQTPQPPNEIVRQVSARHDGWDGASLLRGHDVRPRGGACVSGQPLQVTHVWWAPWGSNPRPAD